MRISPSTANYYISLLLVGLLGSSIVFAMTPKEVALVSEVVVPIVADGKTIGSVKLKAGSLVTVISVQGDEVVRAFQGSQGGDSGRCVGWISSECLCPSCQPPDPFCKPRLTRTHSCRAHLGRSPCRAGTTGNAARRFELGAAG